MSHLCFIIAVKPGCLETYSVIPTSASSRAAPGGRLCSDMVGLHVVLATGRVAELYILAPQLARPPACPIAACPLALLGYYLPPLPPTLPIVLFPYDTRQPGTGCLASSTAPHRNGRRNGTTTATPSPPAVPPNAQHQPGLTSPIIITPTCFSYIQQNGRL